MTTTRLIVIDPSVAIPDELLADLPVGSVVLKLQAGNDPLAQITAAAAELALQGRPADALDLISHGGAGFVLLDGLRFDAAAVRTHAQELAALGSHLAPGADWLLYGCSVAADETGRNFVSLLAEASGADVAASNDSTGAARLGGDWDLEFEVGAIASVPVFDAAQAQAFDALLVGAPGAEPAYNFNGATPSGNGAYVTQDGFFTISAASNRGDQNWSLGADGSGAYIVGSPVEGNYTSTLTFTTSGSFYLNGAVIGDFHTGGAAGMAETDYSQIVVIGYAGGVEVGRTAPFSSVGVYDTAYDIDYGPLQGKQLDTIKIQFDIIDPGSPEGRDVTDYFNVESFDIYDASLIAAQPPANTPNQAPTLSATAVDPLFNESASLPADLFSNVSVSAVENAQKIDLITLRIAGLADGPAEVLRVDGKSVSLVDGAATTTPGLGLAVSVSVSGTTATVTLEKATGISAAEASALIDGLGYRNTSDLTADSARIVTLTGLRDTGGDANGGVPSATFNIASTISLKQAMGAPSDELVDVLWSHNLSHFVPGFALGSSAALGASSSTDIGVFLNTNVGTDGSFEVSADGLNVGQFDLTALALEKYVDGISSAYDIKIIGTKFAGGATITTAMNSAAGSDFFGTPDFSQFTGLSKFSIMISGATASASHITLDSFRVANVQLPNIAPVVDALNGDAVNFLEDSTGVLLDLGSNATVTDSDSDDFNGGTLTVQITAHGTAAEDVLGVRSTGTGLGQIGVSGGSVTYEGIAIGAIAGGSNGSPLTVTFNSVSATPPAVTALLQSLTYANSNTTAPSTAPRSVSITLADGDGGTSTAAVVTVNVTDVNDAPIVTATPTHPDFVEDGGPVLLFTASAVDAVEAGQNIGGLTFTVSNVSDGASEIFIFDGAQIALTHNNSGTTGLNGLVYSVALAAGTASVTLVKAGGLPASTVLALLNAAAYENTSQNPTDSANRVVTLTSISDTGGTANSGVDTSNPAIASTVTLEAVNDAPVLGGGPYILAGTDEDTDSAGTLVSTLLQGLTHSDPDGLALSGVAVTATSGNGTWQYSIDGSAWHELGVVSQSAALLLSSTSQVRYQPDRENGETATLTVRAWDQSSGTASTNIVRSSADTAANNGGISAFSAGTASAQLVVSSVNDAPTNILLSSTTVAEDSNGVVGTLSTSDVDLGTLHTYSIVERYDAAAFVIVAGELQFAAGTTLDFETQSSYAVTVRTTDEGGLFFDKDFTITLTDVNETPVVGAALQAQIASVERGFSFAVPEAAFSDPDAGDTLTYTATLVDGTALPSWLYFDAATRVFSGTPADEDLGGLAVRVRVTDAGTAPHGPYTVFSDFTLTVVNAPAVASIVRETGASELTNAAEVIYTVTFSEAVSGVNDGDFLLASTGSAGGAVTAVQTTDYITYTVTVGSLSGDGTLRLDLDSSGTNIKSVATGADIFAGYGSGQTYTLDHTNPDAPTLALAVDTGSNSSDGVTSNPRVDVVGLEPNGSWEYSIDGGDNWNAGAGSSFDLADGSYAAGDVQVRQTDAAGNTGAAGAAAALAVDTQAATDIVLSKSTVRDVAGFNALVGNLESTDSGSAGAPFTYALVGGQGDADNALFSIVSGQLHINDPAAAGPGPHSVRVSSTDAAGNVFARTLSISVTPNLSPAIAGVPANASAVTVGVAAALADFTVADTDGDALTVTLAATNGTIGQLAVGVHGGVTVTLLAGAYTLQGSSAAINSLLAGATFTAAAAGAAAISISVSDGFVPNPVMQSYALIAAARPIVPTEPTNPANPVEIVDGVQVVTRPGEGGTTIISIPVVGAVRDDDPGTSDANLADIAIVKAADGHAILEIGVPEGVGVQAQGVASGLRGDAALNELLLRIERAGGDADQLGLGRLFDSAVSPSTVLHIQTLTLSAGTGFDASVPFVVRGSTLAGDGQQLVILDARALPAGSVIQVDNVDFIAVIGDVRVIGGAGQNMASGDGAAQWTVLGADDDILHGGGGNDTVGSLGGNDQVFGDAGNDIVFGGTGHDTLSGGTGNDRLDGGLGWDTALQSGSLADYTLATDGQFLVFTHRASGEVDRLKSIEQVKFDSGPALYIADSEAEAAVAHIATRWLGLAPTAEQGAWAQQHSALTALQVAEVVLQAAPALFPGLTAQQLVAGLQDNAQIVRMDVIPELNLGTAGHDEVRVELNWSEVHLARTGIDRWEGTSLIDGNMAETVSVERLHLKDVSVALDTQGTAGQVAGLLSVLFGTAGLTHQGLAGAGLAALDSGMSVEVLSGFAIDALQQQQGHAFTAQELVQLLWTNATGSAGTQQQLQPFVQQLQSGELASRELVDAAVQYALAHPTAELVGVLDGGLLYTAAI
ncbi:DUF4347 domain-containing protein [Acidovorax sp. CCYZU-2555]|uniref:DUF4347 domain-containing protein n=1 Tax=Acidovorax sp. CCYZU-2555 TaxID=2835042 RepID=UPI001BCAE788|nr:DUF4347 domain-containing protein [Acidovorax sp. CCYZU-2555]MBS7780101.1 DUF4347 domain-containing protein [Acidovorax sp. CCYZU-2555]